MGRTNPKTTTWVKKAHINKNVSCGSTDRAGRNNARFRVRRVDEKSPIEEVSEYGFPLQIQSLLCRKPWRYLSKHARKLLLETASVLRIAPQMTLRYLPHLSVQVWTLLLETTPGAHWISLHTRVHLCCSTVQPCPWSWLLLSLYLGGCQSVTLTCKSTARLQIHLKCHFRWAFP